MGHVSGPTFSQEISVNPNFVRLALLAGVLCSAAGPALAQLPVSAASVTPFATGLNGPRGLAFGSDGTLYVAEAGTAGTNVTTGCAQAGPPAGPYKGGLTATVRQITSDGTKTILASGLPSTQGADGSYEGVSDVAFLDGKLYALLAGGGCSHGNPDVPNGIVRINLKNGKWTEITDLSLAIQQHPAAYPNATALDPDGDPYSMVVLNGRLFSVNPNQGQIFATSPDGRTNEVIDVSLAEGHSVPTSLLTVNGNLYVGNLGYFPINPQQERILTLSKDTSFVDTTPGLATKPRELNKFRLAASRAGFTTILSLKLGPDGLLYALEFSDAAGYPTGGAGKVVRLNADGTLQEVVVGLTVPTGMTFGPDGALYVSNLGAASPGAGQILRFALPM